MTSPSDATDLAILSELRRDGRSTAVEVAKKLGVPRTTVVGRIRRLEESRTITGYTAHVDHTKLGRPVTSFVMVSFTPDAGKDQREVARRLSRLPGVEAVNVISGEWDMLVKLRAASIEEVGDVVLGKIRREPGVSRTLTFSSFLELPGQLA